MADFQRGFLGVNRLTDSGDISGGAWSAAYPLVNGKNWRELNRIARATDNAAASTRFVVAFPAPTIIGATMLVRVVAAPNCTVRQRLFLDLAQTDLVHDTGALDLYPEAYPFGSLEWGDPRLLTGRYSPEELAGARFDRPFIFDGGPHLARVIEVQIDNAAATAPFEFGLFEVCTGTFLPHNPGYGAGYGLESKTGIVEGPGGAIAFERRAPLKAYEGEIAWLPKAYAQTTLLEMVRSLDVGEPFMWVPTPHDETSYLRTAFLARNAATSMRLRIATALGVAAPLNFIQWV